MSNIFASLIFDRNETFEKKNYFNFVFCLILQKILSGLKFLCKFVPNLTDGFCGHGRSALAVKFHAEIFALVKKKLR